MHFDVVIIGQTSATKSLVSGLTEKGKKVALISLPDGSDILYERLIHYLYGSKEESIQDFESIRAEKITALPEFDSQKGVLLVNGQSWHAKDFVLGMGAIPFIPNSFASQKLPFETPQSLLMKRKFPSSAVILGGGPIGVSLAHVLIDKRCETTLVCQSNRLLPKIEPELAQFLNEKLQEKGCRIVFNTEQPPKSEVLILATGMRGHTQGFGLEKQGVYLNEKKKVVVNDQMQTSNSRIWALGPLTHYPPNLAFEAHQAIMIANNVTSPFFSQMRLENEPFPKIYPTHPRLATLGLREDEAKQKFGNVKTSVHAIEGGMIKLVARKRSGQIVGVHICAPTASEMILFFNLAMRSGLTIFDLLDRHHFPSPSYAQAIYQCLTRWLETD